MWDESVLVVCTITSDVTIFRHLQDVPTSFASVNYIKAKLEKKKTMSAGTLYTSSLSGNSYKVRLLEALLGIQLKHEEIEFSVYWP